MMHNASLVVRLSVIAVGVGACGTHAGRSAPAPTIANSVAPFDALSAAHTAPGSGCATAKHHQFDFWLGKWDVYTGKNTLAGTNIVKSKLGGCVVEENWIGANLGRGRSLNVYDRSTDTWSQMWVSSGGCPTGVILIEGGFADGSMTMRGRKTQPNGFVIGPPCGSAPPITATVWTNLIRWTALRSGSTLQQPTAAPNDQPLPALPPAVDGNGLRYDRVTTVTPINSPDPSYCPTRAEATQFDFIIGSWTVHQSDGKGSTATATFSKDMQGCLVEERFVGPASYEGMSFNTFEIFTGKWQRTYMDTDGQRVVLAGGPEGASMVMTGPKQTADGQAISVRVTWTPDGPARVLHRLELSRDGGVHWTQSGELVYTRQ